MTITETPQTTAFQTVTFDLYRDIHKGIRTDLFDLTSFLGRLDPGDRAGRASAVEKLDWTVGFLVDHAEHEDAAVQPVIEVRLPDLAETIAADHERLEVRLEDLQGMAAEALDAERDARRGAVHRLYVELAAFTSTYLAHQDFEERVVMPALEEAVGVEAVIQIHGAIIGNIPPQKMAESLGVMIPAMNIDDRAEMLGGMRHTAPAEVFAGVWGLAGSVLSPADHAALASRLGIG